MNLLDRYGRFSFSILSCEMEIARAAIIEQMKNWNKEVDVDLVCKRDVRLIYDSPDGPFKLPSTIKGFLLFPFQSIRGPATILVTSVLDGYSSLIVILSRNIAGELMSFEVSSPLELYEKNSIQIDQNGKHERTVYVLNDGIRWTFFESGVPASFERPENYRSQLIKKRLTPEIIESYLKNLGFGGLDYELWISDSSAHLICEKRFRQGLPGE
jgi:hypothetical protein